MNLEREVEGSSFEEAFWYLLFLTRKSFQGLKNVYRGNRDANDSRSHVQHTEFERSVAREMTWGIPGYGVDQMSSVRGFL